MLATLGSPNFKVKGMGVLWVRSRSTRFKGMVFAGRF